MKAHEILEGITRHRVNQLSSTDLTELQRKVNEIEWALQAITEYLTDVEDLGSDE